MQKSETVEPLALRPVMPWWRVPGTAEPAPPSQDGAPPPGNQKLPWPLD
ncbi:hypothetical protein [Hydrogenophaga palleronii]|nr:hypothetical protein [Hydrogenophaga palleronii]